MKRSRLLLTSVFISAVILVIIGGTVSAMVANNNRAPAQDDVQAYQQREEEYQQLIEQANQQLAQANADLQALQNQAAPVSVQVSAPTSALLSTAQVSEVARKAAGEGQAELKEPELVSYEGQTAYEVTFAAGPVYVDALDGTVLFNGTAPQTVDQEQAIQIASDYFHETDVVLADQITFRGEPLFRVVFKSRLMVYVDQAGQIVYAQYATLASQTGGSGDGGGGSGGGYSDDDDDGEHEDD